jgi:transposase
MCNGYGKRMPAEENVVDNQADQADATTLLQMQNAALQHDKTALTLQKESLRATITQLRHEIALFHKRLYGHRTEKSGTAEMQLMLGDLLKTEAELQRQLDAQVEAARNAAGNNGNDDSKTPTPRNKPTGRRDLSASNLPQVVVVFDDAVLEAQGCTVVGVEESRQLMYRPASHAVLVKQVKKYAKPTASGDTTIVTAQAPPSMFPRGMLHTSMVAQLIVSKFALGTPNYRLEKFIEHQVGKLDRGLMSRYQEEGGNTFGPTVYAAMWRAAIETAGVISTDATGALIQPLREEGGNKLPRGCNKGHFFTAVADEEHVLFAYLEKHTQAEVAKLFAGFKGFLQADASSVYHLLEHGPRTPSLDDDAHVESVGVTLVGCWAHLRRYFYDAAICKHDAGVRGLKRIGAIYAADKPFDKLPPAERQTMRDRYVRPMIDEFFVWVEEARREHRDRTLASKALGYAHNQAVELRRVLDDPRLPLDNTRAERNLRTIVVGRKNWMFYGSDIHAQAAAVLFTMIASCRLHKIEPQQYLDETMRLIPQWPPDRYIELSPARWIETRAKLVAEELAAPLAFFTIPPA